MLRWCEEASQRRVSYQYYQQHDPRTSSSLPDASRRPYVTWALLAINILVWLAMTVAGGSEDPDVLLKFGAMFGPFIADGQYWRLFTAIFLHVGLIHLLFNAFGLFIFGRLAERIYGPTRFALIYLLGGLGGSVLSYLLNSVFSSIAIGAGASGAIFGVLAALAAYFLARRDVLGEMGRQNLTGILVMVAINLFFGFASSGIDNWAHMGGLVIGFAVGFAFVPSYQTLRDMTRFTSTVVDSNSLSRKWWVVPIALGALALGTLLGTAALPENPVSLVHSAQRDLELRRYEDAMTKANGAIQLDLLFGEAYYIRGRAHYELGDATRARADLSVALQLGLDNESRDQAVSLLVDLNSRR